MSGHRVNMDRLKLSLISTPLSQYVCVYMCVCVWVSEWMSARACVCMCVCVCVCVCVCEQYVKKTKQWYEYMFLSRNVYYFITVYYMHYLFSIYSNVNLPPGGKIANIPRSIYSSIYLVNLFEIWPWEDSLEMHPTNDPDTQLYTQLYHVAFQGIALTAMFSESPQMSLRTVYYHQCPWWCLYPRWSVY